MVCRDFITLADGRQINTKNGTIPKQSHFTCAKCGSQQDVRDAIQKSAHGASVSSFAIQAYCPDCDNENQVYSGRYFLAPSRSAVAGIIHATEEWCREREGNLRVYWPREEIPRTYMTAQANFSIQDQGFTHWHRLFDSLQLLVHAGLLKAIQKLAPDQAIKEQALGAFQQFLRMLNNQGFWNVGFDKMNPFFSNANYFVKSQIVTTSPFGKLGYGRWPSCVEKVIAGLEWNRQPWETALPNESETRKSGKVFVSDPVVRGSDIRCHSSSELAGEDRFDLVITDPPFGDNLYYSDLADFFYVWLRLLLRTSYPDIFDLPKTPNAQEAVSPRSLSDSDAELYYLRSPHALFC